MASSEVRDLHSMSPILTRSATRSGKVRRSLDPELASNSIQKTALSGMDHILIFLVDKNDKDPNELFWFIPTEEIREKPEYLTEDRPMTPAQRLNTVTLTGKVTGNSVTCKIFCRVETGE